MLTAAKICAARSCLAAMLLLATATLPSHAQHDNQVLAQAQKQQEPLLKTMEELVSIESGSRDVEGLDRISKLIAGRLQDLGGQVELVEPADIYKMEDTPDQIGKIVRATFTGTGTRKILLLAHMDTVYPRGMLAKQPFRIKNGRAYGVGIADDKQGIAVIIHAIAMLRALNFRDYGTLTVLINADEEISSPGSRSLITRLGAEHDVVLSFEASFASNDKVALATAGIASVTLNVQGRASHAGSAPERGVNALYELSHQILQMRDLSDPATGVKMNWTVARAGRVRNMIPPDAQGIADVRVLRITDYDGIERKVRERVKNQLLPEAKVELIFERRRPPLEATDASRALGKHMQWIYGELRKTLEVDTVAEGGGTDAAFASLKTKAPVIERLGLQGFGAHSIEAEYVLIASIEPRLYLTTRLIMDVSQGKAPGVQ
jgi:glutamate carboxypeptidase